jgi:membrane associated rhomboid family serine protease
MLPLHDNIPHRRLPWVNYGIIAACVVVYLYQLANPHLDLVKHLAFRPSFLLPHEGIYLPAGRILASALATMFMHGGFLHLLFNMWFLWIFGDNVEDRMGPVRYLTFYLVCGFAATAAHAGISIAGVGLTGAKVLQIPMVGASGAIAGVLAAYVRLFPRARVLTLIPFIFFLVVEIPAVIFIFVWFGLQLFSGLSTLGAASGVAFWAHVGGFVAGLVLVGLFAPMPRRPRPPRVLDMRLD